jgi:hypothetical protein
MNASQAPNHWYFPFSRFSARSIRLLLNGNDITPVDVFEEGEAERTICIASSRNELNLRNADPLFSYLPLPLDVVDVLNGLWQRELENDQCDLHMSDLRLFWDGVKIGFCSRPRETWKFLVSRVCCFFDMNEMFCNLIMPILLLSSSVS